MEHQLQHRLLTLVHKTTQALPILQLIHTLGLLLKPVDHLHQQLQLNQHIQVPETTKLHPILLLVHILGLLHSQVDH